MYIIHNIRLKMNLRIGSSQKKRLISEQSATRQIQMKFLDRQSSRQVSQFMQKVMKTSLRKQSQRSLGMRKDSSKSIIKDDHHAASPDPGLIHISDPTDSPQTKTDTNLLKIPMRKVTYSFSFLSHCVQVVLAYGLTIGILYLIQLANFPYFQLILVIALCMSVTPWKLTNLIMVCAIAMVIANYFLGLSVFTYPEILIFYLSVVAFNQKHRIKCLLILAFALMIIYGFILLPNIAASIRSPGYYYLFPLLMLIIRTIVLYIYWIVGHSAIIFLQTPLFMLGLEYGTILSLGIGDIQFWYLIIAFTLQIVNERTQFTLEFLVKLTKMSQNAVKGKEKQENTTQNYDPVIMPAHSSGYTCLHSFHLVCIIYLFSLTNLYTSPYSSNTTLASYTNSWYKPIIVWLLASVYEGMSIILQKDREDKLLFGFVGTGKLKTALRGCVLVIGLWMFYLGLGIGNMIVNRF